MPALDRDDLFAACRAIYEMAGESFVLPPLTRQAAQGDAPSGHVFEHSFGTRALRLSVSLDETCADRNAFPDARLPVKFRAELRDTVLTSPAIELMGRDKHEIVRAFLLGAILPISFDRNGEGASYRLSLQLASTYSVDCGEVIVVDDCCVSQEICKSVSEAICNRSQEFFASRQSGLDVWALRASQDLFGEAPPSAETFWPRETLPARRLEVLPRALRQAAAGQRFKRYAIAASMVLALAGVAGLGSRQLFGSDRSAPPQAVQVPALSAGSIIELPRLAAITPEKPDAKPELPEPGIAKPEAVEPEPGSARPVTQMASVVALPPPVVNLAKGTRSDLDTQAAPAETRRAAATRPIPPAHGKASEARRNAASTLWPQRLFAALTPKKNTPQRPKARPRSSAPKKTTPALTRVIRDIERIPWRIASLLKN